MNDKSYFQHLKERTVNNDIKSMFVTIGSIVEGMEIVSCDWKRAVVVEPPDLDGFFKIRATRDD